MNDKEARHMLDNLRLIHAAYDAKGADLSAWPWKAADEIERLRELNKVLEAGFFEAAKQIAKSDIACKRISDEQAQFKMFSEEELGDQLMTANAIVTGLAPAQEIDK